MIMRFVSLAVVGCAIAAARAETVAWWRFDDKPVGSVTAETDVFANAVDASVFPAHPAVFYTTAATKSYEPELMPVVTDFPDYMRGGWRTARPIADESMDLSRLNFDRIRRDPGAQKI